MGCGESKEQFLARPIQERLYDALQTVPRGQIAEIEIDSDQRYLVDFIRIGGAICWVKEAKPYQGGARVYNDKTRICARYV